MHQKLGHTPIYRSTFIRVSIWGNKKMLTKTMDLNIGTKKTLASIGYSWCGKDSNSGGLYLPHCFYLFIYGVLLFLSFNEVIFFLCFSLSSCEVLGCPLERCSCTYARKPFSLFSFNYFCRYQNSIVAEIDTPFFFYSKLYPFRGQTQRVQYKMTLGFRMTSLKKNYDKL